MSEDQSADSMPNDKLDLNQRRLFLDILILSSIAGLLIAIHFFLPPSLRDPLAFDHSVLNPFTLITSAYVHVDNQHLFDNVGGYLIAASFTYFLCLLTDRRRWFYRTTLVFLFILPILVNLMSYAIVSHLLPQMDPVSRGFSGVVSGYTGFLFVAILVFVRERLEYGTMTVVHLALFTVLVLLSVLLWVYSSTISLFMVGLVAVGMVATTASIAANVNQEWEPTEEDGWQEVVLEWSFVGTLIALLAALVFGLFPADLIVDGAFRNVFSHAAGLLIGGVLSVFLCSKRHH